MITLWAAKNAMDEKLLQLSLETPAGIAAPTIMVAAAYAFAFVAVNLAVIRNTIQKLGRGKTAGLSDFHRQFVILDGKRDD